MLYISIFFVEPLHPSSSPGIPWGGRLPVEAARRRGAFRRLRVFAELRELLRGDAVGAWGLTNYDDQ